MKWVQLYSSLNILWHCLSLGLEWKLTFSCPVATAEFSKFSGILSATLYQQHLFGFENSSAGISSSPLAFFIVMLLKAHLTSHSRMSGSSWVTTPAWLFRYLRFLYSYSVYSCQLFLISCASVRSLPLLSFTVPIRAWYLPLIYPIFTKRSLVFPMLLLSFISLHCSFKKAFLSLLAILWNSAFSCRICPCYPLLFIPQLFVKPP